MIAQAFLKVLPVLLLLLLGYFLGRRNFFSETTRKELKSLIVNVALPATLFLTFARVHMEARFLLIIAIVFSACALVLLLSRRFQTRLGIASPFFPYLMTGFEAGMLGYAIFGAVYGLDNVYKFGVIDLGQVTFVFFVLAPALERQAARKRSFDQVLLTFLKTPVILAILAGVLFNQSGLYVLLASHPAYESVQSGLQLLANLTSPLVALVIGSEIRLDRAQLKLPLRTCLLRLAVWAPAALIFNLLVLDLLLGLDSVFQAALFTMALLPPPYVIPLYMRETDPDEQAYVVNSLSLYTLLSLIAFVALTLVVPPGG